MCVFFFFQAEDGIRDVAVTGVQTCALPVAAKSLEAANELIVKAAAPVFVSVTVIGVLVVASSWLPKSRLVGANPTPGAVPFPLRENICGLPPASSASDSVPVRAPEAVGVKVTLMVQVPPAAKVAGLVGQALAPVLVAAKSPRSEEHTSELQSRLHLVCRLLLE